MRATTLELVTVARHGYTVRQVDSGFGPTGLWELLDSEGNNLQITGHGGCASTQYAAVAEAMRRIELDKRCERE